MPIPAFTGLSFHNITPGPLTGKIDYDEVVSRVNDVVNYLAKQQREMNTMLGWLDSDNALEFGGYYVTGTQLASQNGMVGLSSDETTGNDIRIWAGGQLGGIPLFRVYEDGLMIASNAQITGKVTALSGAIGGWQIASNSITDTTGVVGMSSAVTAGDDVRFFAGSSTPSSAAYRVYESGSVYASNITVAGGSINVASDVTIGDKLILSATNFGNGVRWGNTSMQIYIDPASQGMFITAPGGLRVNGTLVG